MQPASRFCALREGAGRRWRPLPTVGAEAPTEPAGETERLFEKSLLHLAKTLLRDGLCR